MLLHDPKAIHNVSSQVKGDNLLPQEEMRKSMTPSEDLQKLGLDYAVQAANMFKASSLNANFVPLVLPVCIMQQ